MRNPKPNQTKTMKKMKNARRETLRNKKKERLFFLSCKKKIKEPKRVTHSHQIPIFFQ